MYKKLMQEFKNIVKKYDLNTESISITSKALTAFEAIGETQRKDFPILKGKEKLVDCKFKNSRGQAFTDKPVNFNGSLEDVMNMDLTKDENKVIFIATLNAVMKELNLIEGTVHCKDEEPEICAGKIVEYMKENYNDPKILIVGYQPAMIENLSKDFRVRVLDLDKDNIGQVRYNVKIEDGEKDKKDAIYWSDVILITGSTISNGTISYYLALDKELLFFGTTIAGAAKLLNLKRVCFCSK